MIAEDGIIAHSGDAKKAESGKLRRASSKRRQVGRKIEGSVYKASWRSKERASKNWETRFKPQHRETLEGRRGARSLQAADNSSGVKSIQ